jgi:hypothetical protein
LGSEPEAALLVRPIAGLLNPAKASSRALIGRNDGVEDIVEINVPMHDIYNQQSTTPPNHQFGKESSGKAYRGENSSRNLPMMGVKEC